MSSLRVDGNRIVDLLSSVGVEWRDVINVSVGPDPILIVRRAIRSADGHVQADPEHPNEVLADELIFGVDWPKKATAA